MWTLALASMVNDAGRSQFHRRAVSPPRVELPPACFALRTDRTSFIAGTALIPVDSLRKTKRWLVHRLFNIAHIQLD